MEIENQFTNRNLTKAEMELIPTLSMNNLILEPIL